MELIEKAFVEAPRENFVPPYLKGQSVIDAPLPIGFGQTISQPTTVRLMLQWLGARPGEKVLDVGSGSGWTAALLAILVEPNGKVYAVEKIPELVTMGQANCERMGVKNIQFNQSGEKFGLPESAPYDRILVSAAADELPQELLGQLKEGGKMVIPVDGDILEVEKKDESYHKTSHRGFVFVPLIS